MLPSIATFRISLDRITSAITRVVTVPMSIELVRLHDVIQCVMGWQDSHLHEFAIQGKTYLDHSAFEDSDDEDELTMTLVDVNLTIGESIQYTYDMGDNWKHTITILDTKPLSDDLHPYALLSGSGDCPPEDVGGVSGFEKFCSALKKPNSQAYKEYKQWHPSNYDTMHFDRSKAQLRLDELIKSGKGYPWEDESDDS